MAIRQPTKTTIRATDFRNQTFSFPVESVLKPKQRTGKLIISASSGYLLTTSPDGEPTPEQTLDHVLQPDGNRVASGTVTLLAHNEPMEASTITIRNPSGETVILTVDATPQTALATQEPALQVSTKSLTFAKTTPGQPTFLVFTIAQQNATTPVTITTDEPDVFQLASDVRPAFAPTLTVMPSATGTYVHVRYAPSRTGATQAVLTIQTPYTTEYIDLEGPRVRWLPATRTPRAVYGPRQDTPTKSLPTRWLWLTQILVVGLAFAGYQFRCQLMPSLCREDSQPGVSEQRPAASTPTPPAATATSTQPAVGTRKSVAGSSLTPSARTKNRARVTDEITAEATTPSENITVQKPAIADPVNEQINVPTAAPSRVPTVRRISAKQPADSQNTDQPRRRAVATPTPVPPPTAESELERELNKKPGSQP